MLSKTIAVQHTKHTFNENYTLALLMLFYLLKIILLIVLTCVESGEKQKKKKEEKVHVRGAYAKAKHALKSAIYLQ